MSEISLGLLEELGLLVMSEALYLSLTTHGLTACGEKFVVAHFDGFVDLSVLRSSSFLVELKSFLKRYGVTRIETSVLTGKNVDVITVDLHPMIDLVSAHFTSDLKPAIKSIQVGKYMRRILDGVDYDIR